MLRLLLKASPCLTCSRLDYDEEILSFDAGEIGGEVGTEVVLAVPVEYCELVTDLDYFFDCRYGVEVDGEQWFLWCVWHKSKRRES